MPQGQTGKCWQEPKFSKALLILSDSPLVLLDELTDLMVLFLYARAFLKDFLLQTFIFLPMKEIRSVPATCRRSKHQSVRACVRCT